jgi:ankyrin repeat protein
MRLLCLMLLMPGALVSMNEESIHALQKISLTTMLIFSKASTLGKKFCSKQVCSNQERAVCNIFPKEITESIVSFLWTDCNDYGNTPQHTLAFDTEKNKTLLLFLLKTQRLLPNQRQATILDDACWKSDNRTIELCLPIAPHNYGCTQNRWGNTPLHILAMKNNHTGIALFLKNFGNTACQIRNAFGETPGNIAKRLNHHEALELVRVDDETVSNCFDKLDTLFFDACNKEKIDDIEKYRAYGANINARDKFTYDSVAQKLLLSFTIDKPLSPQSIQMFELLCSYPEFDVNARNRFEQTILHTACLLTKTPLLVKIFLKHPAIDLNCKDLHDEPPLYKTFYSPYNNEAIKTLLADPRIDVNIRNKHDVPIFHIAFEKKVITALLLLINHPKIDINAQDNNGDTLLHKVLGAKSLNFKIASAIINHPRIDRNILNRNGKKP